MKNILQYLFHSTYYRVSFILQSAYKQKAKEGLQRYLIIPDDPEFKRLKEAAIYLSSIAYKEQASKEQPNYTLVPDTPSLITAKESQDYQSQVKFHTLRIEF